MTEYTLTRRDALAALAAAGAAGGAALTWASLDDGDDTAFSDHERRTLVAAAETVYPTAVDGIPEFVETYVVGRIRDRPEYAAGVRAAVALVDARAEAWYDAPFADVEQPGAVLRDMGVDGAAPDPDGQERNRVRFYLVNELLYALYTSPTGGRLVGIENPIGYPGGLASYQRGPR